MRTLRLSLMGTVLLTLLGGLNGAVLAQDGEAEVMAFPTGTFVAEEDALTVEFRPDGTCQRAGIACTYGARGDVYTEMTFEDPSGAQVPGTFVWDFDGERLTFKSWGEDPRTDRRDAYANHVFHPVGETVPLPATATDFPTGTFVSVQKPSYALQFDEDGSGRALISDRWDVPMTYAVTGDLFSEMTFSYGPTGDPRVPATYYWDWDGERLTFELWGEELRPTRYSTYTENTWRLVEHPRFVVVAVSDIGAGDKIFGRFAQLGAVPAAEVGVDAFTDPGDVAGSFAAVPISKGQPFTPDMLEPPTE